MHLLTAPLVKRISRHALACVLAVLAVTVTSAAGTLGAGTHEATLEHGGLTRTYRIHIPRNHDGSQGVPLLLALHGGGGSALVAERGLGFNRLSERDGFIVVYPQGAPTSRGGFHWNDGRESPRFPTAHTIDDVGFIRALIAHLRARFEIDPHRIYVTGNSNGGFMSNRLGWELSDVLAAIGPSAGTLGVQFEKSFAPRHPLHVIALHGTEDPAVPFGGGSVIGRGGECLPARRMVELWSAANNCPSPPKVEQLPDQFPDDGTTVRRETYGPGRDGAEVVFYILEGHGHAWPGRPGGTARAGPSTREIDAAEVIWEFFRTRSKPGASAHATTTRDSGADEPAAMPPTAKSPPGDTPAEPPPPLAYKIEPGPADVGSAGDLRLRDDKRSKDLWVRATYPMTGGPHPLIIFSHGHLGGKDNYAPLARHWASHGYIVLQPSHADSIALQRKLGWSPEKVAAAMNDLSGWRERARDVSFLLDALDRIEQLVPDVRRRIDRTRVGVGGHSYGAGTAGLIGGVRAFTAAHPDGENFRDPRVRTILLVSPQGRGASLTENSWSELNLPMMVITGSRDYSARLEQSPQWRKDPYDFAPPGDKYLLWIDNADHGFGGIAATPTGPALRRTTPARAWENDGNDGNAGNAPAATVLRRLAGNRPNADHVSLLRMATTAFWDATLRSDSDAAEFLGSEQLTTFSRGEAALTTK